LDIDLPAPRQQYNTMAPISPKRRKLHHNNDEADSASEGFESGGDDVGSQSSADERTTTAPLKQMQARAKHVKDIDESALYSGGLYKSNMFKLQIDEMLAQVQPNYEKRMPGVNEALHRLKSLIEAIEDREMLPVCP